MWLQDFASLWPRKRGGQSHPRATPPLPGCLCVLRGGPGSRLLPEVVPPMIFLLDWGDGRHSPLLPHVVRRSQESQHNIFKETLKKHLFIVFRVNPPLWVGGLMVIQLMLGYPLWNPAYMDQSFLGSTVPIASRCLGTGDFHVLLIFMTINVLLYRKFDSL